MTAGEALLQGELAMRPRSVGLRADVPGVRQLQGPDERVQADSVSLRHRVLLVKITRPLKRHQP